MERWMNQREIKLEQRVAALEAAVARLLQALQDANIPVNEEEV